MRIHPDVYDKGFEDVQANCDKLALCSAEPTTFTEANVTYLLASVALDSGDFTIANGDTPGNVSRKITLASQVGTAPVTGTATWLAWLDTAGARLLYATAIPALGLVEDEPFSWAAHKLEKLAPV